MDRLQAVIPRINKFRRNARPKVTLNQSTASSMNWNFVRGDRVHYTNRTTTTNKSKSIGRLIAFAKVNKLKCVSHVWWTCCCFVDVGRSEEWEKKLSPSAQRIIPIYRDFVWQIPTVLATSTLRRCVPPFAEQKKKKLSTECECEYVSIQFGIRQTQTDMHTHIESMCFSVLMPSDFLFWLWHHFVIWIYFSCLFLSTAANCVSTSEIPNHKAHAFIHECRIRTSQRWLLYHFGVSIRISWHYIQHHWSICRLLDYTEQKRKPLPENRQPTLFPHDALKARVCRDKNSRSVRRSYVSIFARRDK